MPQQTKLSNCYQNATTNKITKLPKNTIHEAGKLIYSNNNFLLCSSLSLECTLLSLTMRKTWKRSVMLYYVME